ncbi:hypothetical protein [Sporosarcina sp. FSL K6-3457]|uniref:hypothetical protein n=1 Tax=Sporosarcina sp. FSL K6-3457 TaxID=2978204 RepID=UPI0030F718BB
MAIVQEVKRSKASTDSDLNMFDEIKSQLGICVFDYESFHDYVAAIFRRVSTKKLRLCYQLPGDELKHLIEAELKKRNVFV